MTATIAGERPKLAALRVELFEQMRELRLSLFGLVDKLEGEHAEFAAHYTQDLDYAKQHVESAWRSIGYAQEVIEGK